MFNPLRIFKKKTGVQEAQKQHGGEDKAFPEASKKNTFFLKFTLGFTVYLKKICEIYEHKEVARYI